MRPQDSIKLFGLNNLSIEAEIRQIEKRFEVDFGHSWGKRGTEKKPQRWHRITS